MAIDKVPGRKCMMKNPRSPRKTFILRGYLKVALAVVAILMAYFAIAHRFGGVMVMALVAAGLIRELYLIRKTEKQQGLENQPTITR